MIIKFAEWFSSIDGCFGIVVGQDEITKEKKAYIGRGAGQIEEEDCVYISQHGAKIRLSQLENIVKHLK